MILPANLSDHISASLLDDHMAIGAATPSIRKSRVRARDHLVYTGGRLIPLSSSSSPPHDGSYHVVGKAVVVLTMTSKAMYRMERRKERGKSKQTPLLPPRPWRGRSFRDKPLLLCLECLTYVELGNDIWYTKMSPRTPHATRRRPVAHLTSLPPSPALAYLLVDGPEGVELDSR